MPDHFCFSNLIENLSSIVAAVHKFKNPTGAQAGGGNR